MFFTLILLALLLMLIPLGFSVERVFSGRPIPEKLLLTTSIITGLWGGLLTNDLWAGLTAATGLCALMLMAQKWYNRRFHDLQP